MSDFIVVRGARENNLRNVSVKIPKNELTVITGLSGSGKSTLAFDTLYAEGQRRYVESLSSYARQFIGMMNKPDVDSIDGLSPAISIEQKTTSKNPRSTVGTVTEIYDYLRLLYARLGVPYCPKHNIKIERGTPERITKDILKDFSDKNIIILSPLARQKKGSFEKLFEGLVKDGYSKVRVDKKLVRTNHNSNLDKNKRHDIELVIDELNTSDKKRVFDSVGSALKSGDGLVLVMHNGYEKLYSREMSCPLCGIIFEELEPRMFSFNSPFGACGECHGIGFKQDVNPELVLPNHEMNIADGAIRAYKNAVSGFRAKQIGVVAKEYGFNIFTPIKELSAEQLKVLLYGSDKKLRFEFKSEERDSSFNFNGFWEGVIPNLERLHKETKSDYRRRQIERFMSVFPCSVCKGNRLKDKVLAVKIGGKNIIEVTDLSISDCFDFFLNLELSSREKIVSKLILKEVKSRLNFLLNVGLSYLTLSRNAGTLSGGEAQRIRLATQIGSNLTGVLYVLDEPSIGLHQKDNDQLIKTLKDLRDIGNTVIVVEHDEDTIRSADHVIDMGPGAGIHGGRIVSQGTPLQIIRDPDSLTGQYLSGKKFIKRPLSIRDSRRFISVRGVNKHNIKDLDVKIPIGVLTLITGVSGSGKSTLINDVLHKALKKDLQNTRDVVDGYEGIIIPHELNKVVMIDQSPIGRTPRSNPATYTKVFDDIRILFSQTREARIRGYDVGRFSFNVKGGRCEECRGDGVIKIEMHFLPDVYITCEECVGKRYNGETLDVTYKGKSISDVLDMTVEEALLFFENIPKISYKLQTISDVGLGYIKLGQSSTTLSGGESQRIKITRELAKRTRGETVYLLDEPTTGLHFDDVNRLIRVLQALTNKGNTVVVIEHNLDVVKCADWIIDLGPGGGVNGGKIIAQGTVEQVANESKSFTGRYLKKVLDR